MRSQFMVTMMFTILCLFLSNLHYGCLDSCFISKQSVSFLVSVSQVMTDQATRLGMLVCLCRRFSLQGRFLPEFLQKDFYCVNFIIVIGLLFFVSVSFVIHMLMDEGQGQSIIILNKKVQDSVIEVVGVNFLFYLFLFLSYSYIMVLFLMVSSVFIIQLSSLLGTAFFTTWFYGIYSTWFSCCYMYSMNLCELSL